MERHKNKQVEIIQFEKFCGILTPSVRSESTRRVGRKINRV